MADTALSILFGWTVWGTVIAALVGVALGVLGMNPAQYTIAEVCFTIAAIMFGGRMAWWMALELPPGTSITTACTASLVVFGIAGALYVQSIRWVEGIRPEQSELVFSSSASLTPSVQRTITKEIAGAQAYLKRVGFEVPTPIPPIQASNQVRGDSTALVSNPSTLYGDSIFLYGKSVNNRDAIRAAYFRWAFHRLLEAGKYDLLEHGNRWESVGVVSSYFDESYSNKNLKGVRQEWIDALWEMREAFSPKVMDTIMLYTVKNFQEYGDLKDHFDVYFWSRISVAISVIDMGLRPKANQILYEKKIKWADLPDAPPASKVAP